MREKSCNKIYSKIKGISTKIIPSRRKSHYSDTRMTYLPDTTHLCDRAIIHISQKQK